MTLMIFRFCWFFNIVVPGTICVQTTEDAVRVLESRKVEEILWYPGFLEDTKPFIAYLQERHPDIKLKGIDLWTPSHDSCGWFL